MRKVSFLSMLVLVAVVLTTMSETANTSSEPMLDWQRLEDPVYGYTTEFPASGWEAKVTIEQSIPATDPEAILKRYTFVGPEGLIDLDVWSANGREFSQWLEWYSKTRNRLPSISPNAKIAGCPAMIFVEDGVTVDMLTSFFGGGSIFFACGTLSPDMRRACRYSGTC